MQMVAPGKGLPTGIHDHYLVHLLIVTYAFVAILGLDVHFAPARQPALRNAGGCGCAGGHKEVLAF